MNDNQLDGLSMDLEAANRAKLAAVFPECFAEGKLDLEKLLALCGNYTADDFEKYEFRWKGKADCLKLAQKRSTATLRPCREESVNFDTTQNLYLEGDNLEVLKLLQTAYYRQVKMIYIDPPYNTGHDFVYADDFADPLAKYKEVTQQATKSNPETMGRYHTNWLNMMYPRLKLASNLLRDDGVIFISIDDNEVENLRRLCNEVFGEENFVDCIIWKKRYGGGAKERYLVSVHEYVLMYAKNIAELGEIFVPLDQESIQRYYTLKDENFSKYGPYRTHPLEATKSMESRPNLVFPIPAPDGTEAMPERQWLWCKERVEEARKNGELEFIKKDGGGWTVHSKQYLKDSSGNVRPGKAFSLIDDIYTQHGTNDIIKILGDARIFPFPKPIEFLKKIVNIGLNMSKDDVVLDFFSGSGGMGEAIMRLNAEDGGQRRFILVQLPEVCAEDSEAFKAGYKNICEIGKERIRRAGKLLTDARKAKEEDSLFNAETPALDVGFKVFKLDSSNLKLWDGSPLEQDDLLTLSERLNDMIDRVKPERSDEDVIAEIMLKMGIPLTEPVTKLDFEGHTVYSAGRDNLLLICLQDKLSTEDLEKMADFAPGTIILSESALADDSAMSNAHYILKNRGIELKLI